MGGGVGEVWRAVAEGRDVYLFLLGMIALAELAATQGVFVALAAVLARKTNLSARSVFFCTYIAGIIVTTFLSNDATILLLTPAAIALARRANVSPIPAAYGVAFVANAGSFVLPISNPANLLLYPKLPSPGAWMGSFFLASVAAIAVTGLLLYFFFRQAIATVPRIDKPGEQGFEFSHAMRLTIWLVTLSCAALVAAASFHANVGVTAFACGVVSVVGVSFVQRNAFPVVLREGQWSIVPLVAGLLIVVHFADRFGAVRFAHQAIVHFGAFAHPLNALATGGAIALLANAINNLPAAVLSHYAASGNAAALVGIDLGPNISLYGSLATILWANILRKSGERISGFSFLRAGLFVTVPALACALCCVR